jgi:biopolymer transport protein ExbD
MRDKKSLPPDQDLNLVPIMNLVMVLIPLLLISIEFEKMGVINVSAPRINVGPVEEQDQPDEPPLNLTIGISSSGFIIAATGAKLDPIEGCPDVGATICVDKSADVTTFMGEVRSLRQQFDATRNKAFLEQSNQKLQAVEEAFDYRRLYNTLVDIKKKYPDETVVNLGADPDIPFEILVRTMDTVRFKRESKSDSGEFASNEKFANARFEESTTGTDKYGLLFNDVVLAVIQ